MKLLSYSGFGVGEAWDSATGAGDEGSPYDELREPRCCGTKRCCAPAPPMPTRGCGLSPSVRTGLPACSGFVGLLTLGLRASFAPPLGLVLGLRVSFAPPLGLALGLALVRLGSGLRPVIGGGTGAGAGEAARSGAAAGAPSRCSCSSGRGDTSCPGVVVIGAALSSESACPCCSGRGLSCIALLGVLIVSAGGCPLLVPRDVDRPSGSGLRYRPLRGRSGPLFGVIGVSSDELAFGDFGPSSSRALAARCS